MTTTTTQKIETYLPVFLGFYCSIFEYDEESQLIEDYNEENGTNLEFDDFDWDYTEYHKDVSKSVTERIEKLLKENNIVTSLKFQALVSPKYYNYSNDSINIEVEVNKEEITKFITENVEAFKEYIKEHFTSRDGFSSFFSNDSKDWIVELEKWDFEKEETQVGSILDFICEVLIAEDSDHKPMDWLYSEYLESGECFEPTYKICE